MQNIHLDTIRINTLSSQLLYDKSVALHVLRADEIHPVISGNKWFKLRFYLDEAKLLDKKSIITFGGAWSNHIAATAAVCKYNNLKSIGLIRGEEPSSLSDTLQNAREMGMKLYFLSREDYRIKKIPAHINLHEHYVINEGGYGIKGAQGAATLLDHCDYTQYTHICCAAGTGTMTAGLLMKALPDTTVICISVLKNNFSLADNIHSLLSYSPKNLVIIHDYHFGGYAKKTDELIRFMNKYYSDTKIPSDFVYTGKLFFAVNDLVEKKYFPPGSKILILHSGGSQGNNSLENGTLIF